jgi:hypothetical protein
MAGAKAGGQALAQQPAHGALAGRALHALVHHLAADLDQAAVLHAAGAGALAVAAGQAAVQVGLGGGRHRRALEHLLHQVDAAARAVELVAQQLVGGTGGGAEAAVHALAQDGLGGLTGRRAGEFRGEMGLHGGIGSSVQKSSQRAASGSAARPAGPAGPGPGRHRPRRRVHLQGAGRTDAVGGRAQGEAARRLAPHAQGVEQELAAERAGQAGDQGAHRGQGRDAAQALGDAHGHRRGDRFGRQRGQHLARQAQDMADEHGAEGRRRAAGQRRQQSGIQRARSCARRCHIGQARATTAGPSRKWMNCAPEK